MEGRNPDSADRDSSITVTETERLILRHFTFNDVAFIIELLNDPAFIENIGDKGVRNPEDARKYLVDGPMGSYQEHGHGLNLVVLKQSGERMGMCGLVKRPQLEHPDIGFAFLPQYWHQGYAFESAAAAMGHGRVELGLETIVAIVSPENRASIKLLAKLGLREEKELEMSRDDRVLLFS